MRTVSVSVFFVLVGLVWGQGSTQETSRADSALSDPPIPDLDTVIKSMPSSSSGVTAEGGFTSGVGSAGSSASSGSGGSSVPDLDTVAGGSPRPADSGSRRTSGESSGRMRDSSGGMRIGTDFRGSDRMRDPIMGGRRRGMERDFMRMDMGMGSMGGMGGRRGPMDPRDPMRMGMGSFAGDRGRMGDRSGMMRSERRGEIMGTGPRMDFGMGRSDSMMGPGRRDMGPAESTRDPRDFRRDGRIDITPGERRDTGRSGMPRPGDGGMRGMPMGFPGGMPMGFPMPYDPRMGGPFMMMDGSTMGMPMSGPGGNMTGAPGMVVIDPRLAYPMFPVSGGGMDPRMTRFASMAGMPSRSFGDVMTPMGSFGGFPMYPYSSYPFGLPAGSFMATGPGSTFTSVPTGMMSPTGSFGMPGTAFSGMMPSGSFRSMAGGPFGGDMTSGMDRARRVSGGGMGGMMSSGRGI